MAAIANQLEYQWDHIIPSEIASDRVMDKSEGSDRQGIPTTTLNTLRHSITK